MSATQALASLPSSSYQEVDYRVDASTSSGDRTRPLIDLPRSAVNDPQNFKVFVRKAPVLAPGYFRLLQSFEGTVQSCTEISFVAVVVDKTNSQNPREIVEISLDDVTPDDRRLVEKGAVFYWSIGYRDLPGVPRQRSSQIRFQRLAGWSRQQINQAKAFAESFSDILQHD